MILDVQSEAAKEKAVNICVKKRRVLDEFFHENKIEASNESIKKLSIELGIQEVQEIQDILLNCDKETIVGYWGAAKIVEQEMRKL